MSDLHAGYRALQFTVSDGFDFAGPFVRGVRDDRHLGLIWGDLMDDETLQVFRGAKLRLVDVDPGLIEQALRPGHKLIARIRLTDASAYLEVASSTAHRLLAMGGKVAATVAMMSIAMAAESTSPRDAIVVEGNHYFPPASINSEYFRASGSHTVCG